MSRIANQVYSAADLDQLWKAMDRGERFRVGTIRNLIQSARLYEFHRLQLARLARPDHPRGGFFNPLEAWEAQSLADEILNSSGTVPSTVSRDANG